MKIGAWDVQSLDTGRFRLDGGAMFGVVPKILWEKSNPADGKNRIEMALRGLLIRGPGRIMVVDPGIGEKWDAKQTEMFGIDHSTLSLDRALAAKGVRREDVTDVMVSHLHFDHVGGCTRWGAAGKAELGFPNATYYVHEGNVAHSHAPTPKDRASFLEHTIQPLLDSSRLKAIGDDYEFAPGVSAWITHGHTPGQLLVRVLGEEGTILFCGDTIPTASHIPLAWVMAYDLHPMTTIQEKQRILEAAAAQKWILAWVHDPFVAASTVRTEGNRIVRDRDLAL
jgi:glyoxylase-like metal-dependent hydrolase (beta-lactamase superfamily II)